MSEMIKLTFPDGAIKEFAKGTSTDDVAYIKSDEAQG